MVTDGNGQNTSGGAEAGKVPCTHRALDEVIAQGLDVDQHEGVERPVQAQWDEEWVEHWDGQGEDERNVVIHPGQAGANAVTGPHAEGADEEGRQRDDEEHGKEGDEDHVNRGRDDLLETLVEQRSNGGHNERDEDVSAVVLQLHGHAENLNGALLRTEGVVGDALDRGVLREIEELRGEKSKHDRCGNPGVDAQLLASVISHHDRQEEEDRTPHSIHEEPRGRLVRGAEVHDFEGIQH